MDTRLSTTDRTVPWFCPSCRRKGGGLPASGLCSHCGSRVESQGYCPVCEDFQPLAAGELCPKHDVELEAEVPPTPSLVDSGPWAELDRFPDANACHALRIRLEAEGIPTDVQGERVGSRSMYSVAVGGVSLRVPEAMLADARVIQSQTWSKDAAELGVDDEDDWDEDGFPEPDQGLAAWGRRTALTYLAIELAVGIGLAAAVVIGLVRSLG